jgi:pimeloyl-ACP methyl ester carboxylesterase
MIVNMVHPPQTSSMKRWEDAPTRSVDVAGARFVYRQLGPAVGVPAIMLNHWGAVLDNFDPRIVDGLAATRPVIALAYRGAGASTGKLANGQYRETPVIAVVRAGSASLAVGAA